MKGPIRGFENVGTYNLRMKVAPGLFDASEGKVDHSSIASEWTSFGIVCERNGEE